MTIAALPAIPVTGGLIRGTPDPVDPSITEYLAIPYAAPPLGKNRFRSPQPVEPWDGVKVCDTFGPVHLQAPPPSEFFDTLHGVPQSEDNLHLNVWVPQTTDAQTGPFPVFVYIHGGGWREGGNADRNFVGTGLARKGVIVVVPNFRLGMSGFLAHPDLTAEDPNHTSGNQGLLDIIQALHWVKDNIAKFGGDPSRVTIGGQSSGCNTTQILVFSPLTKGLISGAIMQSGPWWPKAPAGLFTKYRYQKDAEAQGKAVLDEMGIKSLEELRAYPDGMAFANMAIRRDPLHWGPPALFRQTLDGYVLTKPYSETLDDGVPNDVPIMFGHNAHEGGVYVEPRFTIEDLHESVYDRFGGEDDEFSKRFLELYPPADEEVGKGPLDAWNKAARDHTRVNMSLWAQDYAKHSKSPIYGYCFTHEPPNYRGFETDWSKPKVHGYKRSKGPLYGAFHGAEFAYTFNSVIANDMRPWTKRDYQVGETMSSIWANFIKYGNPNGQSEADKVAELPQWDPMTERPDTLMELGKSYEPLTIGRPEAVQFWKDHFQDRGAIW